MSKVKPDKPSVKEIEAIRAAMCEVWDRDIVTTAECIEHYRWTRRNRKAIEALAPFHLAAMAKEANKR